jgi:UDP-N-acetylglucosamine 2-epimerase
MLNKNNGEPVNVQTNYLPMIINYDLVEKTFSKARQRDPRWPVLAVVTGTKPDFYKQAPLVTEAINQGIPTFVIDTGQHYDEILGYGTKEFKIEGSIACTLQIRGNLMEKASELLLKFASFGKICNDISSNNRILPIVHGDTLVAGITPLSWLFGTGQKVAQNEAGLRSMSPYSIRSVSRKAPSKSEIEWFIQSQFERGNWFLAREEPFPEQVDTWICSAGSQYFFAPAPINKENLIREGYPEENIYVVGNSVVDAIQVKRKYKPLNSIFEEHPELYVSSSSSSAKDTGTIRDEWIRVDIHRRENLTRTRFFSIIESLVHLVKIGYKVLLVKLTATQHALLHYGLEQALDKLSAEYPNRFIQTPLWREYGQVVEFLDSGACWLELTDSGSMQEELLYFPKVKSVTIRLNTDRPETIFDAQGNVLAPPISPQWIVDIVRLVDQEKVPLITNKKRIYGSPGQVSTTIIRVLKKSFEEGHSFYPWLHQRLGLWKEGDQDPSYL